MVDWVALGTELLLASRKAKGYSYEAMGRLLNVSAKTWERWEKRGAVPRHMLRAVAAVLELEIEHPPAPRIEIPAEPSEEEAVLGAREDLAAIRETLALIQAQLALLLRAQEPPPNGPRVVSAQ